VQSELRQGALQRGVVEGAGMTDMLEDGGGVRAGSGAGQAATTGYALLDDGGTRGGGGGGCDGGGDDGGSGSDHLFALSDQEESSAPFENNPRGGSDNGCDDDFGLATLIQSAYNEVGILDGEAQPNEEALLAGASATMQWAVENREMDVDVRLLNAYLSVFARCMRLHRALIVYRSFETDFGQPPNADSAIIILEMLTRANQLDRALAFFRVATGEWTHDEAVAETRHWNIKRPKGVRKRKKMQGMPPPRIVPEEGYGPCVFGGSVEVGREEDGASLVRMYGVLLRGCAKNSRFEVADELMREMHERGLHPRLKDTFELRRKILMEATEARGGDGDLSEAEARVLDFLPEDSGVREIVERELMLGGGGKGGEGGGGHSRLEEGGGGRL
jgi:pentatricopeptide repeat protein